MFSAEISRICPALILFLLDQSTSMSDPFGGKKGEIPKSIGLADVVNQILIDIVLRSSKGEIINDYFLLSLIGYGHSVSNALPGPLAGKEIVTLSELARNPLRIEDRTRQAYDGSGKNIEEQFKKPVWLEPVAKGGTPMRRAFEKAKLTVQNWINEYPDSFPPIVINVSDGEANDGDPEPVAREIMALKTSDGPVLLFNVHLSSSRAYKIEFPDSADGLPDEFSQLLFRISSPLPPSMLSAAREMGFNVGENARGFVLNADIVTLVQFLEIGTRPANPR